MEIWNDKAFSYLDFSLQPNKNWQNEIKQAFPIQLLSSLVLFDIESSIVLYGNLDVFS